MKESERLFHDMHQYVSSFDQIIFFLKDLIRRIIPVDLLGECNFLVLLKSIKQFIEFKKFENIKLTDIVCKMDVFEVPWLKSLGYNKHYKHTIIKRYRKIIADIIYFIYNDILMPVVRYNFYVTEKHKEANKLFYYRKPLWNLITKLAIIKLE